MAEAVQDPPPTPPASCSPPPLGEGEAVEKYPRGVSLLTPPVGVAPVEVVRVGMEESEGEEEEEGEVVVALEADGEALGAPGVPVIAGEGVFVEEEEGEMVPPALPVTLPLSPQKGEEVGVKVPPPCSAAGEAVPSAVPVLLKVGRGVALKESWEVKVGMGGEGVVVPCVLRVTDGERVKGAVEEGVTLGVPVTFTAEMEGEGVEV